MSTISIIFCNCNKIMTKTKNLQTIIIKRIVHFSFIIANVSCSDEGLETNFQGLGLGLGLLLAVSVSYFLN